MTDSSKTPDGGSPDSQRDDGGDNQDTSKPNDPKALEARNQELLALLRKSKDALAALEAEKKARETKALEDQAEWKKLAEQRAEELAAANAKLTEKEAQERDRAKLAAVLDAVGGKVDRKYWGLIDLDKVGFNPETGEVDKTSAAKYAETFRKEHSVLVQVKKSDGIVKDDPKTPGNPITHAEWLKLPAKEMAARLKDVMASGK